MSNKNPSGEDVHKLAIKLYRAHGYKYDNIDEAKEDARRQLMGKSETTELIRHWTDDRKKSRAKGFDTL